MWYPFEEYSMHVAVWQSKLMKMFVVSAHRNDCELPWPF